MSVRSNAIQPVLYNTTAAVTIADGIAATLISKVFGAGVYLITGTVNMSGATLTDVQFVTNSVPIFDITAPAFTVIQVPVSILWTSTGSNTFSIIATGTGSVWSSAVTQIQVTKLYSTE